MAKWPSTKPVATKIEQNKINGQRFGVWEVAEINPGDKADTIVTVNQIHGGNIVRAEQAVQEKTEADGILLTAGSRLVAGIKTADCAPVVVMAENRALALHVSRKTIVNGLLDNVMSYLEPKEIDYVYVGPHICEFHNSFAREEFMLRRFRLRFGQATHWHRGIIYISLKTALQYFFNDWEIHPNKIHYDGRCTYEMMALPSAKRDIESGRSGEIERLITTVRSGHAG